MVLSAFKLILKAFDLFAKVGDQLKLRVYVEVGLILDLRSFRGVVERAQILFRVRVAR